METSILPKIDSDSIIIKEVWKDNLEQEFNLIRNIIDDFPFVGMDAEFPGVVVRTIENSTYQNIKANVNILKIIQLGLTLSDEKGNLPTCCQTHNNNSKYCVWQFNFCGFDPSQDPHNSDSIKLLSDSGLDFVKNNRDGIAVEKFGELLMSSGAVLNDEVHWVIFHGGSDFGYLLKLLTGKNLPGTEAEFFKLLDTFFPVVYDVKHLINFSNDQGLHGGLNKVAARLGVRRIGVSHQAGSDSLLTCQTFLKLKQMHFNGSIDRRHVGVLHGLDRS